MLCFQLVQILEQIAKDWRTQVYMYMRNLREQKVLAMVLFNKNLQKEE